MTRLPPFPLLGELVRDPRYLGMHETAFEWWELACDEVDTIAFSAVLATRLGVHPRTMISRCERAGVPSPKKVLVALRLLRVGQLLVAGLKPNEIVYRMHYAGLRTFRPHVRQYTGHTLEEYRREFVWSAAREQFIQQFYLPHRTLWRRYSPALTSRPALSAAA